MCWPTRAWLTTYCIRRTGEKAASMGDHADGLILLFVPLRRDIALAPLNFQLGTEEGVSPVIVQMCWSGFMTPRTGPPLISPASHRPGAVLLDEARSGTRRTIQLEPDLLEVENDLGNILMHPVDGGELVQRPVQPYRGDGRPRMEESRIRRKRIADGRRKATLKWLADEICRTVV